MLHSHFFSQPILRFRPKTPTNICFLSEEKITLRSKEASMQLDMNELILQAPLSLGAVCLPSGLRECDIYQKSGWYF